MSYRRGMRCAVLTGVRGGEQLYIQKNRFQIRTRDRVERSEFSPADFARRAAAAFGIDPVVCRRAAGTFEF